MLELKNSYLLGVIILLLLVRLGKYCVIMSTLCRSNRSSHLFRSLNLIFTTHVYLTVVYCKTRLVSCRDAHGNFSGILMSVRVVRDRWIINPFSVIKIISEGLVR